MYMKSVRGFALLVAAFATASLAIAADAFEVSAPDLSVGSWWTYVRRDIPSGAERERYTNTIAGRTDRQYSIVRTDATGAVLSEYTIAKNLGQNSAIDGNVGDGNLVNFPLVLGKKWSTRGYFVNSKGFKGRTDTDFKVVGIEDVTVPAGTFPGAIKIQGSGIWSGISQPGSGAQEDTVYYSEKAGAQVRTERLNGPFDRSEIVLVAYERK